MLLILLLLLRAVNSIKNHHFLVLGSFVVILSSAFKAKCRMLLLHETMGQQFILYETDDKKNLWHLEIQDPVL